jgi:N-acetylmuramic acid 6-phosphate etherase
MTSPQNAHSLVPTEQINPATRSIDLEPTANVLALINQQDHGVACAVEKAIPAITVVVDRVTENLRHGGRLFYVGAGTSGRLAVLDAAECPPTFSTPPDWVQAIIAGGPAALTHAIEGAEDSSEQGTAAMEAVHLEPKDVLIGISASGGAAFVLAAIEAAEKIGCFTAGITCNSASQLAQVVHQAIVVEVGPEVIAGSTRMKAGTAQKLVLNMISTASMIQLGKTYENLMVDVKPTNQKLRQRAIRIVSHLAAVSETEALQTLEKADFLVKPAVLMLMLGLSFSDAQERLVQCSGKLRLALQSSALKNV